VTESRKAIWISFSVILIALIYLLAPVVQPFLISAAIAYFANPTVKLLERYKFPRTIAVIFVFFIITLIIFGFVVVLLPIIQKQILELWQSIPSAVNWLEYNVFPLIEQWFGITPDMFNVSNIKQYLDAHFHEAKDMVPAVYSALSRSSSAIVASITFLLLVPVVTFYLMRDWEKLLVTIQNVLPTTAKNKVCQLSRECDQVLGAFMRGQLTVMLALAVIYGLGLRIIGVDFALLLGLIAGIASVVPYLGLIVGLVIAGIAALIQFQDLFMLGLVAAVFVIGQLIEGAVLTPLLVGDKIGLHPIAVIFAILAGGYLFGFVGILIALPVAAVLVVILRHLHSNYLVDKPRAKLKASININKTQLTARPKTKPKAKVSINLNKPKLTARQKVNTKPKPKAKAKPIPKVKPKPKPKAKPKPKPKAKPKPKPKPRPKAKPKPGKKRAKTK